MAVTAVTLQLAAGLRIQIGQLVDQRTRVLVQSWARAWDQVHSEMAAAVEDLLAIDPGRWPTRAQIVRATRARRVLALAEDHLSTLARRAGVDIVNDTGRAVHLGAGAQIPAITSQLPAAMRATVTARLSPADPAAIEAIVERVTGQVENILNPLASDAAEAMRQALVRGVAVGDNPRTAAARMVRGLEGQFNGGLTRALLIARTETLDAHRAGAMAAQNANRDVLDGWQWNCSLDRRACASCWSKHGSTHPLDEPGPMDHQSGRCSRTPLSKSWKDLGFTIPEPPSVMPDARAVFNALPDADRLAIMGPRRLAGIDNGTIGWADLSVRRTTAGWRDSWGVRPVKDLLSA